MAVSRDTSLVTGGSNFFVLLSKYLLSRPRGIAKHAIQRNKIVTYSSRVELEYALNLRSRSSLIESSFQMIFQILFEEVAIAKSFWKVKYPIYSMNDVTLCSLSPLFSKRD